MLRKPILREATRALSLSKAQLFCNLNTVKRISNHNPGYITTYFTQLHGSTISSPNALPYSHLISSYEVKLNEVKCFSVLAENKDEEQKDGDLSSVSSHAGLPQNVIDSIRKELEVSNLQ